MIKVMIFISLLFSTSVFAADDAAENDDKSGAFKPDRYQSVDRYQSSDRYQQADRYQQRDRYDNKTFSSQRLYHPPGKKSSQSDAPGQPDKKPVATDDQGASDDGN